MNVFEPLFLLLVLVTVITLIAAVGMAISGRFARAVRTLKRLAVGVAAYFAVVVLVSIVSPRRTYRVGDAQCFDDWCITVTDARWTATPPGTAYEVVLRLSSRARRTPMGEKGTVVYLTDIRGLRYDPLPDQAAVPFDTKLPPGGSVVATRHFDIPRDARGLGLVYTHEGGFPIGWFIISEGGWFQKPPLVRLD